MTIETAELFGYHFESHKPTVLVYHLQKIFQKFTFINISNH